MAVEAHKQRALLQVAGQEGSQGTFDRRSTPNDIQGELQQPPGAKHPGDSEASPTNRPPDVLIIELDSVSKEYGMRHMYGYVTLVVVACHLLWFILHIGVSRIPSLHQ